MIGLLFVLNVIYSSVQISICFEWYLFINARKLWIHSKKNAEKCKIDALLYTRVELLDPVIFTLRWSFDCLQKRFCECHIVVILWMSQGVILRMSHCGDLVNVSRSDSMNVTLWWSYECLKKWFYECHNAVILWVSQGVILRMSHCGDLVHVSRSDPFSCSEPRVFRQRKLFQSNGILKGPRCIEN